MTMSGEAEAEERDLNPKPLKPQTPKALNP